MADEKRLIDANALVNTLMSTIIDFHQVDRMNVAIKYVVTAPTVDAVEVVHGRWVPEYEYDGTVGGTAVSAYGCSVCHGYVGWLFGEDYKYCPHCGAKMDGDWNA